MNIQSLETSANKIVENLDSSIVNPGENFYIFKNTSGNTFDVFTTSSNDNYQYINKK
jgi:hypothetical protein